RASSRQGGPSARLRRRQDLPSGDEVLRGVGARAPNHGGPLPRETPAMKYRALLTALVVCGLVPRPVAAADDVFDSNGVKIRYVTEGKGEPVVLIHGWMADSSMWGRDQSGNTKLDTKGADGFQLIALDCRGHGKSDKLYDPGKYGPEMAADVVRLLD